MDYYSAIKRNKTVPFAEMRMNLETVTQSEVSQKEKNKYNILMHLCGLQKNGIDELICQAEIKTDIENKRVETKGVRKVGMDGGDQD